MTRIPLRSPPPLPSRTGPAEFAEFRRMMAIRCPQDFAHNLQRASGMREPGSRRWLVTRHRIGPVSVRWAGNRSALPTGGDVAGLSVLAPAP